MRFIMKNKSSGEEDVEKVEPAAEQQGAEQLPAKKRVKKKGVLPRRKNSILRPKKCNKDVLSEEVAQCIACRGQIAPSMKAFEEHSLTCAASRVSWDHAARLNAETPSLLVDRAVELDGGLRGVIVGLTQHKIRRWLPTTHEIQFESGRREQVVLEDGRRRPGASVFRLLDADEARKMKELRAIRVARELENVRQHAEDCIQLEKQRSVEVDIVKRMLEEERLCPVCLDRDKDTALVPCGHRICLVCSDTLRGKKRHNNICMCPICRVKVDRAMRVF